MSRWCRIPIVLVMVGLGWSGQVVADQQAADEPVAEAPAERSPQAEDRPAVEEAARLRQRVQALEHRVQVLEHRLERLEQIVAARPELRPRPPAPPLPGPRMPQQEQVPDHWIPREHNGLRYYIVPLDPKAQE
jgi:hypothetical protein